MLSTDRKKALQTATLKTVRASGRYFAGLVLVDHGPICTRLFDTSRLTSKTL